MTDQSRDHFFSISLKKKKHTNVNRGSHSVVHVYQGPSGSLTGKPKHLSLTIHFNVSEFLKLYTWLLRSKINRKTTD